MLNHCVKDKPFRNAAVATGPVRLWPPVAVAAVAAVWLLWRSGPVLTCRPCHAALKINMIVPCIRQLISGTQRHIPEQFAMNLFRSTRLVKTLSNDSLKFHLRRQKGISSGRAILITLPRAAVNCELCCTGHSSQFPLCKT